MFTVSNKPMPELSRIVRKSKYPEYKLGQCAITTKEAEKNVRQHLITAMKIKHPGIKIKSMSQVGSDGKIMLWIYKGASKQLNDQSINTSD